MAADQPTEAQILDALKAKRLTRCPQVRCAASPEQPRIEVEIPFSYASAQLHRAARARLVVLGDTLRTPWKDGELLISGHTDAKGGYAYNQRLSERRADAVRHFLMEKFNMRANNLKAVGFGKARLKDPAKPFAAENRRVEVVKMPTR